MVNKDVYINKKTAEIIYSHNDRVVPSWPQTITIYSLQEAIKLHRVRSRRSRLSMISQFYDNCAALSMIVNFL